MRQGWSFEQLISYASRASWVKAGEVLASGTCDCGAVAVTWSRSGTLGPRPLRVGDVIEMSIERLGTIRNQVVAWSEADLHPSRRWAGSPGRHDMALSRLAGRSGSVSDGATAWVRQPRHISRPKAPA